MLILGTLPHLPTAAPSLFGGMKSRGKTARLACGDWIKSGMFSKIACLRFSLFFSYILALPLAHGAEETLTRAAEVLALSSEEALRGVPVQVKGIVTVAEKYWDGRFFVQDESGGVFVDNISTNQPQPGDVIEVRGISHPGAFAPVITKPDWKKIGNAPLPEPRPVAIDQLMSGVEDSQRVQIT